MLPWKHWLKQRPIYTMTNQFEPGNRANFFLTLCRAVLPLIDNSVTHVGSAGVLTETYDLAINTCPINLSARDILRLFTQLTLKPINYHP